MESSIAMLLFLLSALPMGRSNVIVSERDEDSYRTMRARRYHRMLRHYIPDGGALKACGMDDDTQRYHTEILAEQLCQADYASDYMERHLPSGETHTLMTRDVTKVLRLCCRHFCRVEDLCRAACRRDTGECVENAGQHVALNYWVFRGVHNRNGHNNRVIPRNITTYYDAVDHINNVFTDIPSLPQLGDF